MRNICLFSDDFRKFPIGEFPYDPDHSAAGEYHYVTPKGVCGEWKDQVCNYRYNGHGPSWIVTEENGKHYMEQSRIEKGIPHRIFPTLQTGNTGWKDYDVSVSMRRISTSGMAGIAFCMNNSIDTLVFSLEEKKTARLAWRHKEEVHILTEKKFMSDSDQWYKIKVSVDGKNVKCFINSTLVMDMDTELAMRGGKIGITADCPTQFTDIYVSTEDSTFREIQYLEKQEKKRLKKLQASYPHMKLVRKLDLQNFGTSRQIRFGHLLGNDEWQIVIPQAQKRVDRDAYAHISCLTAIDLNGNILWQIGEPSENSNILGKISADLPCQVYDIDGDGYDEVITAKNFQIQILDGRTGKIKKSAATPVSDEDNETLIGVPYNQYAFDRINPDGIRICNFRGLERPSDILIKDRLHLPLLKYYDVYKNIYTASSCSKTLNVPGLIGSYAIIPDEKIRDAFLHQTRRKDFLNSVSIFGMYATMVGYTSCDDYIDQMIEYLKGNMKYVEDFIRDNLKDFSFEIPDATYLAWIDARKVPFTSEEIQDALVHVGKVAIMKGEVYGDNGAKYLRMNCGCPRSKLEEGMKRLKKAMDWLYEQKK